ncbi:MAG: hypothetical protein R2862_08595 [Thermoanaerobaculia bacterium]
MTAREQSLRRRLITTRRFIAGCRNSISPVLRRGRTSAPSSHASFSASIRFIPRWTTRRLISLLLSRGFPQNERRPRTIRGLLELLFLRSSLAPIAIESQVRLHGLIKLDPNSNYFHNRQSGRYSFRFSNPNEEVLCAGKGKTAAKSSRPFQFRCNCCGFLFQLHKTSIHTQESGCLETDLKEQIS